MHSKFAVITFYEPGEGPSIDNTLPSNPVYPTTGPIYGGGHPSHGLPGGGHISTLPVFPFDPTLPVDPGYGHPEGGGEKPDNSLPEPVYPSHQPIMPGTKLVVKWLCGVGLIGVPAPK